MVSARSAGALGGGARVFEVWLHLMKLSEANELVGVLIFGQEACPLPQGSFGLPLSSARSSPSIGTCAGGPL